MYIYIYICFFFGTQIFIKIWVKYWLNRVPYISNSRFSVGFNHAKFRPDPRSLSRFREQFSIFVGTFRAGKFEKLRLFTNKCVWGSKIAFSGKQIAFSGPKSRSGVLWEARMPIAVKRPDAPPLEQGLPGTRPPGRAWEVFGLTRRRPEGSADFDQTSKINNSLNFLIATCCELFQAGIEPEHCDDSAKKCHLFDVQIYRQCPLKGCTLGSLWIDLLRLTFGSELSKSSLLGNFWLRFWIDC